MSALSARDAAFLAEMGIGPLWSSRNAPAPEPEQAAAEQQPVDMVAAEAHAPAAPVADASAAPAAASPAAASPVQAAPAARQAAPADSAWNHAAPAVARPVPAAREADQPTDAAADAIARMDWDELQAAIASCTRCGACREGRKPVSGTGARSARWLVVAGASTAADEQAGHPLAGDTGKLLDQMLFAVEHARDTDVYITNLVKCRPVSARGGDRAPSADEVAACRPFLERELALTGAGTVLTLGQIAANGLLGKELPEPLAGARGAVHALAGRPLVATLHPGELLRRGADKALAWADLCRARAARARSG